MRRYKWRFDWRDVHSGRGYAKCPSCVQKRDSAYAAWHEAREREMAEEIATVRACSKRIEAWAVTHPVEWFEEETK